MQNMVTDEVWQSLGSHAKTAIRSIVENSQQPFILLYRDENNNSQMVVDRLTGADALHISFSLFAVFSASFGDAVVTPTLASLILGYSSIDSIETYLKTVSDDIDG